MPYVPELLATSELQQVRYLLGGSSADELVSDGEISFNLIKENNIYYAAAACAEGIAGTHTNTAYVRTVGPLSHDGKTAFEAWNDLAKKLRSRGAKYTGSGLLVGISFENINERDTQREYPQLYFKPGLHDHPEAKDV